jgi:hypothetical protein
VAAQQLLTDTDAQHGLPQLTDDLVQTTLTQIFHGSSGFALPGKDDTIGTPQLLGIVCQQRFYTQAFQGVDNRIDVAGIIFDYRYIHGPLLFFISS